MMSIRVISSLIPPTTLCDSRYVSIGLRHEEPRRAWDVARALFKLPATGNVNSHLAMFARALTNPLTCAHHKTHRA